MSNSPEKGPGNQIDSLIAKELADYGVVYNPDDPKKTPISVRQLLQSISDGNPAVTGKLKIRLGSVLDDTASEQ
jgi:hypothetical protein